MRLGQAESSRAGEAACSGRVLGFGRRLCIDRRICIDRRLCIDGCHGVGLGSGPGDPVWVGAVLGTDHHMWVAVVPGPSDPVWVVGVLNHFRSRRSEFVPRRGSAHWDTRVVSSCRRGIVSGRHARGSRGDCLVDGSRPVVENDSGGSCSFWNPSSLIVWFLYTEERKKGRVEGLGLRQLRFVVLVGCRVGPAWWGLGGPPN